MSEFIPSSAPVETVSGSAVTLGVLQLVPTIRAFAPGSGMSLTLPTAVQMATTPQSPLHVHDQADFTVINASVSSGEVTILTPLSSGDLTVAASETAIFRIVWNQVQPVASARYTVYRISGTDPSSSTVTTDQLLLESSQNAVDAIRLNATNLAGGIDIDAGTGGITIDTTGPISLDSSSTAVSSNITTEIDLNISSVAGSVNISSGEANIVNAISIDATNGGVSIVAAQNIDLTAGVQGITCTSNNINIISSKAGADALLIEAIGTGNNGGMIISGGTAGINITSTGNNFLSSSVNSATAIHVRANHAAGGVSITSGTSGITIDGGLTAGTGIILNNSAGDKTLGTFRGTGVTQRTSVNTTAETITENFGGTVINEDSVFGGYTVGQIVAALRQYGLLA